MGLIAWLVLGGLAGWIACIITGKHTGLLMTIIIGIVGAFLGGFLAGALGLTHSGFGFTILGLIIAVIGATILLWVTNLFGRSKVVKLLGLSSPTRSVQDNPLPKSSPSQPKPATPIPVQGTTMGAPANVQLLREENVREQTTVIDTEEYPLDNRNGGHLLTMEYEVSKTASNEVSVQATAERSGILGAQLLTFLKAEISAKLAQQTGHKIGETVTRRQKLTFSVEPGGAVVYQVIWKRKVRTGTYIIASRGVEQAIPYQVTYDLTYEVRTA